MAGSVLHVVELDHAEPSHAELLATWETSKGRIDRVSFTPAFPSLVALATANGFFQLVDSSSGTFRVYAVLVASVPCDVGPRCMALDAASCVVGRGGGLPSGLSIVFALAYSSTLCRADVDSGVITELVNFDSRPSAVCAEADHVAAGDGRGDVSLWRTSEPDTPLLWTKKQLAGRNQEVTALSIARDAIFAGIADYSVKVLSMRDGALTASLVSEGYAPIRAIAPFTPYTDDIAVATSKGLITVWRPSAAALRTAPTEENNAERTVPKSRLLAPDWTVKTILNSFPVSTASFRNGFLVVGGADGRLALFTTANITSAQPHRDADATNSSKDVSYGSRASHDASALKMAVCYDLEHAILSGFVTDDSCLTAVTKAGDVWRWPLSDVLAPPMPDDEDSEPTPQGGTSHNNTSYGTGANLHEDADDDHGRFDDVNASADQLAHQHQAAGLATGIYQGYGASPAVEAGVPGSSSVADAVGRNNRNTSVGSAGVNTSPLATYPDPDASAAAAAAAAEEGDEAYSMDRRNTSGMGSTAAPSGVADHFADDGGEHAGDNGSVFGGDGGCGDDDDERMQNDVIVVDMDVATPPDGCLTEVTASSSTRGFRTQNAATAAAIGGALRRPKAAGNQWNLSDVPSSVVPVANVTPDATPFATDATGVNNSAPTPAAGDGAAEPAHDRSDEVTPRLSPPMPSPPPAAGGSGSATARNSGVVALPRVDPVEIDGLLAGRRMDPRAARHAADRYDRFVACRLADAAGERGEDDAPHPLGVAAPDGSSRMLRRELRGLMGEHADPSEAGAGVVVAPAATAEDTEDPFALALKAFEHDGEHVAGAVPEAAVDQYMAEHKAATEAMAFANPIRPFMKFESDDVVFRAVGLTRPAHERLCDHGGRRTETPTASTPARVRDDLAPATVASGFMRRRDRRFEKERRAEGPALTDHLCGDLLVPPAGPALFFDVYHSEIAPAPERVVPLPAAPTPTVA